MSKGPKIFWREDEKRQLGEAVDLLVNVVQGYTHISALIQAQPLVLPENRRRKLRFWANVRDQLEPYVARAKELRQKSANSPASVPFEAPHSAPPSAPSLEEQLAKAISSLLVKVLANPQVISALHSALGATAGWPDTGFAAKPALVARSPSAPGKPHKQKLLIAGLLPAQAEEIKKDYAHQFDLRFWRSDESKDQLRNMLKHTEVAIGVTSFIGHPADAILKDLAARYVRHPGGVKTLKATLDTLTTASTQRTAVLA